MKLSNRTLTFAAAVALLCCTVTHGQYGEPCGGKVTQVDFRTMPYLREAVKMGRGTGPQVRPTGRGALTAKAKLA